MYPILNSYLFGRRSCTLILVHLFRLCQRIVFAIRYLRQRCQPRGQFPGPATLQCAPAPIAFSYCGSIHPRLASQLKQVLRGNHRELSHAVLNGTNQRPHRPVVHWPQIRLCGLARLISCAMPPSLCRVVVMRAGVGHQPRRIPVRQVNMRSFVSKAELQQPSFPACPSLSAKHPPPA